MEGSDAYIILGSVEGLVWMLRTRTSTTCKISTIKEPSEMLGCRVHVVGVVGSGVSGWA